MSSETQTFDPNGDVVLILNCPPKVSPISGHHPPTLVNMLASSKHMILASSVFAAMLKNDYKEGRTLESKGKVEIGLPDDEPDAFVVLLNIIHGRLKKVPRRIDLRLLTELSILVDKYQMHEVVEVFSEMWIEALKANIPKTLTADALPWLCISWVFENDETFKKVTEMIIRTSDSELDKDAIDKLPIPEAVIDKLQYERRQEAISDLLQAVYSLLGKYGTPGYACKRGDGNAPNCDAMVLGSILKGAHKALVLPFPEPPYKGFIIDAFRKDILEVRVRTLCDLYPYPNSLSQNGWDYHCGRVNSNSGQACNKIKQSITETINSISGKFCGLSIKEFK